MVRRLNDVKQPLLSELSVLRGMPSSCMCLVPLLAKAIAACTTCREAKAKPYETGVSGVLQCAERELYTPALAKPDFLIYHGIP